ncbi:MAG: hypothetical protein EOM72_05060 [Opitutae bacterium]|nr:hypothetical protein [Opitutae bacterium]
MDDYLEIWQCFIRQTKIINQKGQVSMLDSFLTGNNAQQELDVFHNIVSGLTGFDIDTQTRILQSAITFLKLGRISLIGSAEFSAREASNSVPLSAHSIVDTSTVEPKQFMIEKAPHTDIERVACLAYYLTHYRETPNFTTLEISKTNTEAAQPKFANAAQAVKNATYRGFLVPSIGGKKQLGATGEQFVQALPDRDAAKQVLIRLRVRKQRKGGGKIKNEGAAHSANKSEK